MVTGLVETFGFSPALALVVALAIMLLCGLALIWVVHTAPPRTLTLTSGPIGSSFARYAEGYQKSLATHGVKLEVLPSVGSGENLRRLKDPTVKADVGFVQGGLPKDTKIDGLMSLGSVAYQPVFVFYRGATPATRLSDFAGKRIGVGAPGSGTRSIALALLEANGVTGEPTKFEDFDAQAAATALLDGKLDAIFLMGDSAPIQTLRTLVRTPEVQLFSFAQADAYVRRFPYLTRMVLTEGSFDLGKNLPAQDIILVGTTVELVAREDLNSALSDILLETAREIHGKAGLLQKRGEFPAPLEHEFPISDDARVYYKSGMGLFYRLFHSFWLASVLNRILLALVPLALVILPSLRILPVLYRWSVQLRLYRCYRPLMRVERDAFGPLTRDRIQELLAQLDDVETQVSQLKVPASFASQLYELKGHLAFVRLRLQAAKPQDKG